MQLLASVNEAAYVSVQQQQKIQLVIRSDACQCSWLFYIYGRHSGRLIKSVTGQNPSFLGPTMTHKYARR